MRAFMVAAVLVAVGCGGMDAAPMPMPEGDPLLGAWALTSTDVQRMSELATFGQDGTFEVVQRVPVPLSTIDSYKTVTVDGTFVAGGSAMIIDDAQSRIYVIDGDTLTMTNPQTAGAGGPMLQGTYARQ